MTAAERVLGDCTMHGERMRYVTSDPGPREPGCTCERIYDPVTAPQGQDEYAPTTDDVRNLYVRGVTYVSVTGDGDAEFDRWLAAHDAEVAARALREAADDWPEDMTRGEAQRWLEALADRIERQEATR